MDDDPSLNPGAGGPLTPEQYAREMGKAATGAVVESPALKSDAASGLLRLGLAGKNTLEAATALAGIKTWEEADKYFEENCDPKLYNFMKEASIASEELDSAAATGGRRNKKRKSLVGGVDPITMFITIIDAVCASATKFKRNVGTKLQILMNGTVSRIMATGGDGKLAEITAGYIWAASKYLVGAVAVRALSNDLAKGTSGVTGLVVLTVVRSILLLVPDNALQAVPGVLEIAGKTTGVVRNEILKNPSKYVAAIVAALGVQATSNLSKKENRDMLYTKLKKMFGPVGNLFENTQFDESVEGLAVALEAANLSVSKVPIPPGLLARKPVVQAAANAALAAAPPAPAAAKRPRPTEAEISERKKASKEAFVAKMKEYFDTHRDATPEELAADAAIEASLTKAAADAKAAAAAAPPEQVVAAVEEAQDVEAGVAADEAAEQERAELREGDLAKEVEGSAAARRVIARTSGDAAAAPGAGTGLGDMSAKPKLAGGKRRKSTRKVRRSFRRSARRLSRRKRMNKA
uniref:Uncharacterized protein n=1 Tax=viral metagenome TaxID=1070528 RepID=A0A6C0I7W8_9ZZZZ